MIIKNHTITPRYIKKDFSSLYVVQVDDLFIKNHDGTLFTESLAHAKEFPFQTAHRFAVRLNGKMKRTNL